MFAGNSSDAGIARASQSINERVNAIGTDLVFFTLELNRIDAPPPESPVLARWEPFLRDLRVFRPHQLSDEIERTLHEKEVTGRAAWSRLFDETIAGLRVQIGADELTVGDALNRLSDPDRAAREVAAHAIGAVFASNVKLFSLITNTLIKDKEINDGWRHYPRPGSARNRANMVEDDVVDALVAAVTEDFPRLSHRYYALKAGWLGLDKLEHWDRNAPLPGDADRRVGWDEARARVLGAYHGFDAQLGEIAQRFFDKPWIDAPPRPGKAPAPLLTPRCRRRIPISC